jgi:hypothetical protein
MSDNTTQPAVVGRDIKGGFAYGSLIARRGWYHDGYAAIFVHAGGILNTVCIEASPSGDEIIVSVAEGTKVVYRTASGETP